VSAPDELRELLEAYWDGSLDREGARRLAGALRSGEGAVELAGEVELSSLMHQASDGASGEELVRRFFAGMGIDGALDAARPADAPARLRRRMVWAVAAAAAVLALVGALLVLRTASPRGMDAGVVARDPETPAIPAPVQAASPVGSVLAGSLEARPRGAREFTAITLGGELSAGDAIRSGAAGPVEIVLGDGVRLLLDAGTEAVIAPDGAPACAIELDRGQIFADVVKGSSFSVLTAEGSVRSLGTRFAVSFSETAAASAPGLVVSVEEGVVEVDAGGEVSRVESGCSLLAGRGCLSRQENGEPVRRRLGWVDKWRGEHPGNGAARGRGHGAGPRQGGAKGRGGHGNSGSGGPGRKPGE